VKAEETEEMIPATPTPGAAGPRALQPRLRSAVAPSNSCRSSSSSLRHIRGGAPGMARGSGWQESFDIPAKEDEEAEATAEAQWTDIRQG
jgi:hypothetical protein